MKQLTSAGFLEVLRRAPEWQLVQGPGTGQLLLATRETPKGEKSYFLGPQPLDTDLEDYKAFAAAVEDIISMRGTHDDQSTTDIGVEKGKMNVKTIERGKEK